MRNIFAFVLCLVLVPIFVGAATQDANPAIADQAVKQPTGHVLRLPKVDHTPYTGTRSTPTVVDKIPLSSLNSLGYCWGLAYDWERDCLWVTQWSNTYQYMYAIQKTSPCVKIDSVLLGAGAPTYRLGIGYGGGDVMYVADYFGSIYQIDMTTGTGAFYRATPWSGSEGLGFNVVDDAVYAGDWGVDLCGYAQPAQTGSWTTWSLSSVSGLSGAHSGTVSPAWLFTCNEDVTQAYFYQHSLTGGVPNTVPDSVWDLPAGMTQQSTADCAFDGQYVYVLDQAGPDTIWVFDVGISGGGSTGGPDDFGYRWIDSDAPGGPVFNWIEISGTGTATNAGDDDEIWPIPFPGFTYYGMTFDTIGISANGAIYFEDLSYWPLSNYALPYGTYTEQFMAMYWDDLNPGPYGYGEIYWEVIGDQLVIEWDSVPNYGTSDYLKAEIILDRTNGDIFFQYLMASSEQGSGATVGIQGASTTTPAWYLQYSYDSVALHDNLAIRFYYIPPDHDVSCSEVVSPPEGSVPAADYDVIGRIRNYGATMETFDVTANVYDTVGMVNVFTQTVTLTDFPVGGDSNVNFGTVTFNSDSYYYTEIFTELVGDVDPSNDTASVYSWTALSLGDVVLELDIQTITGNNRLLGVEFDGANFYVTGGTGTGSNSIWVIDTFGTVVCQVAQPTTSSWGMRDLAWDGVYAGTDRIDTLYASDEAGLYKFGIDLTGSYTNYGTITGPVYPCRALAWDGDDEWFFTANWTPYHKFSKTTPLIQTQSTGPGSTYGAAYDTDPVDGGWIWWHSQVDPGTGYRLEIDQMEPATMNWTGLVFGFIPPSLAPSTTTNIAGGLCFHEGYRGWDVLFALVQGDPVDEICGIYVRDHVTGVAEEPGDPQALVFGFAPKMATVNKGHLPIAYTTTTPGHVSLKVYDGTGRLVQTLVNAHQPAGEKSLVWNNKDMHNRVVANGVYFFKLEAENLTAVHKMVLVK